MRRRDEPVLVAGCWLSSIAAIKRIRFPYPAPSALGAPTDRVMSFYDKAPATGMATWDRRRQLPSRLPVSHLSSGNRPD